jgi:hypothetical protein
VWPCITLPALVDDPNRRRDAASSFTTQGSFILRSLGGHAKSTNGSAVEMSA